MSCDCSARPVGSFADGITFFDYELNEIIEIQ